MTDKRIVSELIAIVMRGGADFVEVFSEYTKNDVISYSNKKIETVSDGVVSGVGIRAFVGTRTFFASTNDTTPSGLYECANRVAQAVGGSVMTYGKNSKTDCWTIGLRDPKGSVNDTLGVLRLDGENYVSTSGSYEKYFEQNGVRYHHIIDYSVGAPAQRELVSVTVVAPSGILSDSLSTACFVLDMDSALEVLSHYDCQAIFVFENGDIIVTDGLADKLEIRDDSYRIVQVSAE